MEKEMLLHFSDDLHARLQEVLSIAQMLRRPMEMNVNQHDPMDEVDLTTKRYEHQMKIHIQQRTLQLAREIEGALKRIKNGEFGTCRACGSDIELNRLRVHPTTTLCIDCKREMEGIERRKVA